MPKRKQYLKFPKIVTVTCVTCGAVIDVLLEAAAKHRKRFYCSERCEAAYLARARRHALETRGQGGTFEGKREAYQPLQSRLISERPAGRDGEKHPTRKSAEAAAKAAKDTAMRQRDLEYWAALRRAKGITVGVEVI